MAVASCWAVAEVSAAGVALVPAAAAVVAAAAAIPSLVVPWVSMGSVLTAETTTLLVLSALVSPAAGLVVGSGALVVGVSAVVSAKVASAVERGVAMLHKEVLQQLKSLASVELTELNMEQFEEAMGM
mmetsp:Transcript_48332/g.100983  ORF Transcript_48332/g.100983 Transcript_48332/m.100983 type:complete len:128 (-) Transcript_48332:469-852(-)